MTNSLTSPAPHSKVTASHLGRTAMLYVRQSTLRQVAEHQESTRRQYALRERAVALGWQADQIVVIDADLGMSGASATDRTGFQRLVGDVAMERVGIVLGLEVSRLARNSSDWHRLLELCALADTLILDEDGLYDPSHYNDRLLLGLKGTMSEAELHVLRARMQGGLLAKAARGELRIALPVGLVYDLEGHVVLHPDEQVQGALRLFFDTYARTGSACATVKHFNDNALLFPKPAAAGWHTDEVVWGRLSLARAVHILHSPRYAGAFAFGRRRYRKRADGRRHIEVQPAANWHALLPDAHPGYISWEAFQRNQDAMLANARRFGLVQRSGTPREGPALLQGLALCGRCGARMTVRYHRRKDRLVPDYVCLIRTLQHSAPACQIIPGADIDDAIARLVVEAMTPMAIEMSLAVQAEIQARIDEADLLRRKQVQRAEYDVDLARRRYMQVDPGNRLVASSLEAEWNDRLRALDECRAEAERQRQADRARLDDATRKRIVALSRDFPAAWADPRTPDRERKRMIALLLEDVTLTRGERIVLGVRFRGGATTTLELPIPLAVWRKRCTHPAVVDRIEDLLGLHEDAATIAHQLNAEGLRTGAGAPFDASAVRWVQTCYGLKSRFRRIREQGNLLTAFEMAARLGVSPETVRLWARQGRLLGGRRCRKPTWLFEPVENQPHDIQSLIRETSHREPRPDYPGHATTPPEVLAEIERLLDLYDDPQVADHLNAQSLCSRGGRPYTARSVRQVRMTYGITSFWTRLRATGKLTSPEMAAHLGIGVGSVEDWVRNGRLRGAHCGVRRHLLLEPIDAQPEPIRERAAKRAAAPAEPATLRPASPGRLAGYGARGAV